MSDLSNISQQLSAAADALTEDNAEAQKAHAARLIAAMHQFCDEYGLSNGVGMLADYAENKVNTLPEDSAERSDYELAAQILDGAAAGVDLPYSNPCRIHGSRADAVERVQEMARGIAP